MYGGVSGESADVRSEIAASRPVSLGGAAVSRFSALRESCAQLHKMAARKRKRRTPRRGTVGAAGGLSPTSPKTEFFMSFKRACLGRTFLSIALLGALASACTAESALDTSSEISGKDEGSYQLYFSNPLPAVIERIRKAKKPEYNEGNKATWEALAKVTVAGGGNFQEALTALMKRATGKTCSVLVADYVFNRSELATAMVAAKQRGCDVRLVTDGDTVEKADRKEDPSSRYVAFRETFGILRAGGVEIHHDGGRGGIMHNKFAVVTGTQVASVWAGSWNFTRDDEVDFWNNGIQMNSVQATERYRAVFEDLYARYGSDGTVLPSNYVAPADHTIAIGTTNFEVYFPQIDRATPRIVKALKDAKKSIHTLAFSFTSKEMKDAVVERVNAGVEFRGVFDNTGACRGAFKDLSALPVDRAKSLRWPYGPANFMHHKVFILDRATTIFSSFNFSSNADKTNDVIIVTDAKIAAEFEKTYALIEQATALTPQPSACVDKPTDGPSEVALDTADAATADDPAAAIARAFAGPSLPLDYWLHQ
jgi:phosphatidylserine/phosphatidylglycerophosphate/cardiolipin synthase-like enzyme